MTSSLDDRADQPDDKTGAPADDSAAAPRKTRPATKKASTGTTKAAAVKTVAARTTAKSTSTATGPGAKSTTGKSATTTSAATKASAAKTATAKTAAAKAAAAKADEAKITAAKSTAAKTTAAKTAAAKNAASRAAATQSAAKTTASKTTSAKTAAAKAAATKAAAAKAAAAAKEVAAKESAEKAAVDPTEAAAPVKKAPVKKAPAKKTPAKAAPAAKSPAKTTPPKTTVPKTAPAKTTPLKTTVPKSTARSKAVAADDAAPTSDAVISPTDGNVLSDAAAADELFADALADETDTTTQTATAPAAPEEPEPAIAAAAVIAVPEPVTTVPDAPDPAEVAADSVPAAAAAAVAPVISAPVDPSSTTEAVVIRGLVKDFGDQRAVNGIDLTIPAGSFYGIVGPNGAGKTTTLSILAGLLRADDGQVIVCGVDQATDALGAKRVMGVLPDRLRTFDRLTGRQLLHYYGLLRGLSADVIERRSADLVRAFDLSDAVSRVVSDYSAGMTKKIMLAGAMIHSPRVLVLDEPFEAVDPVSSAVILDILRAYVTHGGTVILSSHGMDLVEQVCSRVAIIVGGDVLAEGTIDEVRAGQTLASRFVELSGGIGEVEGLEWLHTFSD